MRAWMISKKEVQEIVERARREAMEAHPKQARRRFDAMNAAIATGIREKEMLCEFGSFAQLEDVAGIVLERKKNLGTKKWSDYRTQYLDVTGKIERETEQSIMIGSTWYRKSNVFAVIRDWNF